MGAERTSALIVFSGRGHPAAATDRRTSSSSLNGRIMVLARSPTFIISKSLVFQPVTALT